MHGSEVFWLVYWRVADRELQRLKAIGDLLERSARRLRPSTAHPAFHLASFILVLLGGAEIGFECLERVDV